MNIVNKPSILVVGGNGNMGSAMLKSWHVQDLSSGLCFFNRPPATEEKRCRWQELEKSAKGYHSLSDLPPSQRHDVIVYTFKPKDFSDAMIEDTGDHLAPDGIFLTIAAGSPIKKFAGNLKPDTAIIRAMPNTPLQIGQGVTGLYAPDSVSAEKRAQVEALFSSCGMAFWVDAEEKMHAVTAISGSGPGFAFYLMEQCEQVGLQKGLSAPAAHDDAIEQVLLACEKDAAGPIAGILADYTSAALSYEIADAAMTKKLVTQTFRGAALLAQQSPVSFAALRAAVTSPNGTTEAGVKTLDNWHENVRGVADLKTLPFSAAIAAAEKRSRELAL